ncbi:hypothetical protein NDU88_006205 [Pleurodeles waltl]|uniref:Uncharacterized protein n=1 Tax=Pleurodeles waltl TaxID=8319 RepID=A0AAV7NYQ1_PLEWA|nr:hypothetical protein NDU88_006205 [Pleurodeles waltl]
MEEVGNVRQAKNRRRNRSQGTEEREDKQKRRRQETRAQRGELHLGHSETRQPRSELLPGDKEGRGCAGAGYVLGRTWPEQVWVVYWGIGRRGGENRA